MAKKTKKAAPKRTAPRAKARAKATAKVTPIPEYLHAVTANLVLKDSVAAIAFYEKAFGAKVLSRMASPDGKSTWHAELRIGDSVIFLNDASPMNAAVVAPGPDHAATAVMHLYVRDCDATIAGAIAAGAKVGMPAEDMFWGDRMGSIVDPFGLPWSIGTRKAKLTPKQMQKAAEEFVRKQEPVAFPHEPGAEEYGPGDA